MDYKYTATFEAPLLSCEINKASLISEASLKNLEPLIPKEIDYNENVDLMGVAFNAAVINQFNKNGDGMDAETAVKYTNKFIHKPTNIEHDKQKVVGHIVSAGYSDYKSSELIEEETAASMKEPFNIALGAVLYKTINSSFTNLVEKSLDENSKQFQKVSASWEVGFNDYGLAVGSDELSKARIVSDPEEIAEMQGFLRSYGGNGKTDKGETINRLIKGDIYPLGIAYTLNPAADVKGLYSSPKETKKVFISDKRDKISQNRLMRNLNLMTKIVNSSLLSLRVLEMKLLMRHLLPNSIFFGKPKIKRSKKSSTLKFKLVLMKKSLKNFQPLQLKRLKSKTLSTLLKLWMQKYPTLMKL